MVIYQNTKTGQKFETTKEKWSKIKGLFPYSFRLLEETKEKKVSAKTAKAIEEAVAPVKE